MGGLQIKKPAQEAHISKGLEKYGIKIVNLSDEEFGKLLKEGSKTNKISVPGPKNSAGGKFVKVGVMGGGPEPYISPEYQAATFCAAQHRKRETERYSISFGGLFNAVWDAFGAALSSSGKSSFEQENDASKSACVEDEMKIHRSQTDSDSTHISGAWL